MDLCIINRLHEHMWDVSSTLDEAKAQPTMGGRSTGEYSTSLLLQNFKDAIKVNILNSSRLRCTQKESKSSSRRFQCWPEPALFLKKQQGGKSQVLWVFI